MKRIFSLALALFLTIGLLLAMPATASAASQDRPSPWALDQVNQAIDANLVPSSLQSRYTQAITRAEFASLAVILYEHIKGEIMQRTYFTDTSDINVQKAAAIGIVTGIGDGMFNPNGQLTRQEAAVMLSRLSDAMERPLPTQAATFSDNSSIAPWAIEQVGRVQAAGIITGIGDNMFSPLGAYTREQSIITIRRMMGYSSRLIRRTIKYDSDVLYTIDANEYDVNGRMTKTIDYDINGSFGATGWSSTATRWVDYEYDANNRLTKTIEYDANGSITSWGEYEYNANNQVSQRTYYLADGSIKNSDIFLYDANGQLIEYSSHDIDGSYFRYDEYNYSGQLIKRRSINNRVNQMIETEYNADGIAISELNYLNGVLWIAWVYQYYHDSNGQLIATTQYYDNGGGRQYTHIEYNANGRVDRRSMYTDSELIFIVDYEYDTFNRVIRLTTTNGNGSNAFYDILIEEREYGW